MMVRTALLLLAMGLGASACGVGPELDHSYSGTLSAPLRCGVGNFTVVHIDPNGHAVDIRWKAFNQRHGNAMNIPFEEITIVSGDESYVITDRGVGNGALKVNGRVYPLVGAAPTLVVRFGEGVSFAPAYEYSQAHHWYDPF